MLLDPLAVIYFVLLLLLLDLAQRLFLMNLGKDRILVHLLVVSLVHVVLILQLEEEMVPLVGLYVFLDFATFDLRIIHKSLFPSTLHLLDSTIIVFPFLNLGFLHCSIVVAHPLILSPHSFILLFFLLFSRKGFNEPLLQLFLKHI